MGSSEGAAAREALLTAQKIALRLATAIAKGEDDAEGILHTAAFDMGVLIGRGLLDRTTAADLIQRFSAPLALRIGDEAIQELMVAGSRPASA
jgi:hypothetical protein